MPQAKTKKTTPVKFSSYTFNIGVKECMVWPDGRAKPRGKAADLSTHVMLPKKQHVPIGKALTRGYDLSDFCDHPREGKDDDHVIDALRGWPRSRIPTQEDEDEIEKLIDMYRRTPIEIEAQQRSENVKKMKKNKATGQEDISHKKKGNLESTSEPDPHMGDLISHRFLTDAAREREEEKAKERKAAMLKRKMDYAKKFPKDIKATKASQLRSIAQAEKVISDPKSLWQMSKFRDNAQPSLDTFREPGWKSKGQGRGAKGIADVDGGFYTCTCAEEQGLVRQSNVIDDAEEPELDFAADRKYEDIENQYEAGETD